ncbi:MAG: hypothetical protein WBY94_21975 [Polyangiaceae bacterium]
MRTHRNVVSGLCLAAAMGAAPLARADDSAAAQALFDQAKKAMAAHDYAEACPKLEESLRLQSALGTLLNLAQCYEFEGKLASAWSKYLEVSAKARAAGQAERARIGHDRAAALAPKLSNLAVDVPPGNHPDGLEIRRDGTLVGAPEWGVLIPADAGLHTIVATAPGRQSWSRTLTLSDAAATARVTIPDLPPLPVEPAASPAPSPVAGPRPDEAPHSTREAGSGSALRVAAVGTGVAGVAGLGVGGAFGLLSMSNHDTARRQCPTPTCSTSAGSQSWTNAVNDGNISTLAFIVGGAAVALGVTLWLIAPSPTEPSAPVAHLALGPGSVGINGVW